MSESPADRLFDVQGKRALVTGAASGIGQAFAEVLADSGARVTLADIDEERLALVTGELASAGRRRPRGVVADISDPDAVDAAFDGAVAAHGGLDIVFANAGIAAVPGWGVPGGQELHTVADEVYERVLAINQHGVLYTMRAAAAVMKPQGSGRIMVTASTAGLASEPLVVTATPPARRPYRRWPATPRSSSHSTGQRQRDRPGALQDPHRGRRRRRGRAHVGVARAARAHGRHRGAQGPRPAALLARRELHHGRRDPDRRRPAARHAASGRGD